MNYPISVFLDSNIFIASKYNTSESSQLGILRRHIKAGKIKLFLSNIVKREVEAHIDKDTENAVVHFEKALKAAKNCVALKSLEQTSLNLLLDVPNKECIKSEMRTQFEQYLKDCEANILDNQGIACEDILNDYFLCIAPFENNEKKKYEFPDAIIVAKLKKEFSEDKKLWVISDDDGFRKALYGNTQFQCLPRLQDLYDLINRDIGAYSEIMKYFSYDTEQIKLTIMEELKSLDIEVDGTDYDRKGMIEGYEYDETNIEDISNLEVELDSVDEISESNAIVTVKCLADFYVHGSYYDFDNGIWDSEDKEYIFVPHYDVYEEHKANFYCELKLEFKEDTPDYQFCIESMDFDIKLDKFSRVNRTIGNSDDRID